MKRGDKGTFVSILQTTLAELGYDPGPIDGVYGSKTEAAVKKYQNDLLTHPKIRGMIHGGSGDFAMALESDPLSGYTLTASGEVDDTLWMALSKHRTLMVDDGTPDDTTGGAVVNLEDDDAVTGGSGTSRVTTVEAGEWLKDRHPGLKDLPDEEFRVIHQRYMDGFDGGNGLSLEELDYAVEYVLSLPPEERAEDVSDPTTTVTDDDPATTPFTELWDELLAADEDEARSRLGEIEGDANQAAFVSAYEEQNGVNLNISEGGWPEEMEFSGSLNERLAELAAATGDGGYAPGTTSDAPWGSFTALQEALLAAGFDPGPIDGVMGPLTQAAITGISADGWATLLGTLSADTGDGTPDGTTPDGTTPDGDGDPTEPPDEIVTDEDTANLAAAFGYGARFLAMRSPDPANPETDSDGNLIHIGDVLAKAAEEGWYDNATGLARLEAAIKATDWWDDFDRNERNHQLLEASDPAEAERLLDLQVDRLQRAATRLGLVTIADDRFREMARDAHVENWSDYQINQNMLLEAEWAPGQAGGAVEDFYSVIDAHAGDYMVGHLIDDTDKDEWAHALYLGDATEMGIRNDIAALAQSAFPSMDARIGQGYTVRQILSPLRQEAARLLEIDASSIDLMTDPRFQEIWEQQNDDGTTRVMSVAEVGQHVRGLEDWQTTTNATDAAYRFADFIGTKFGKAA